MFYLTIKIKPSAGVSTQFYPTKQLHVFNTLEELKTFSSKILCDQVEILEWYTDDVEHEIIYHI